MCNASHLSTRHMRYVSRDFSPDNGSPPCPPGSPPGLQLPVRWQHHLFIRHLRTGYLTGKTYPCGSAGKSNSPVVQTRTSHMDASQPTAPTTEPHSTSRSESSTHVPTLPPRPLPFLVHMLHRVSRFIHPSQTRPRQGDDGGPEFWSRPGSIILPLPV